MMRQEEDHSHTQSDHPDGPSNNKSSATGSSRLVGIEDDGIMTSTKDFCLIGSFIFGELGMPLDIVVVDENDTTSHHGEQRGELGSNPAYQDLKRQQQVVQEAMEEWSFGLDSLCAIGMDRWVQVGWGLARQFHNPATHVRPLRQQESRK